MRDVCWWTLIYAFLALLWILVSAIFAPASRRQEIMNKIPQAWANVMLLIVALMSGVFVPGLIVAGLVIYCLWMVRSIIFDSSYNPSLKGYIVGYSLFLVFVGLPLAGAAVNIWAKF